MTMRLDRWIVSLGTTLLAGVACLSLAACRLNAASVEGSLSATASDAKSLIVKNENGSVEIVKDPAAATMQVSAKVRCVAASKESAEARLKDTTLVAERDSSGRVRVQVVFPSRVPDVVNVTVGWNASSDAASLVIRAANLDGIEVETSNGSITCGAFAGPVHLDTSNGAIEATGVGTPVIAETSNGRIEVSLSDTATGDVKIDTSNGRAELRLSKAWQGTVRADTSNGSIETLAPTATVINERDEATVTFGDGTKAKATIDTSNGRVTIRGPAK
jgi:DUF4097 and DUF4098 domain-containing protein YvlB